MRLLLLIQLGLLVSGCNAVLAIDPPITNGDAGGDAHAEAAPSSIVSFAGQVQNLDTSPIANATVTFVELPSASTTTSANGAFTMQVPTETPLTVMITAVGEVKTVEQTVVLHAPVDGASFSMATQAQYKQIASFGAMPAGSGVFFINVSVQNGCAILGAHLSTSPASGKIVYAEADQLPNASYTSIQPNAPGGFVVGASGTITLNITDVTSPCAQAPWPVDMGAYTVLGPITVQGGAFHDTSIFVRNPG